MYPYWILFIAFAAGALQTRAKLPAAYAGADREGRGYPLPTGIEHGSTPLLFAAVAFAALLIGFRYEVGADWIPYTLIFEDISYLDFRSALSRSDPGYATLNWLANAAGLEIWAVNLACGALFCFGLLRFAKAQPNPWLAVVVAVPYLVIGVAMGYSRQAVAIGFTMCALASIGRGSVVRFVLWMMLAATFHRTAIVIVPIVAISFARNRLQAVVLGGAAAIVGYFVLLAPAMDQYSRGYLENVYEAQGAGIRLAMNVIPAALFLIASRRFGLNETERITWRNLSLLALAAFGGYFLIESTVIVDRLGLYLIPLQLFALSRAPIAFGNQSQPSRVLLLAVLAYSAVVQFVWLNFANHAEYWIPYRVYPLFWEA